MAQRFFSVYLLNGSREERKYAEWNTIYVFAQYLGWVEIVRRRVQFLDLGSKQDNRVLVNCFATGTDILSSDSILDPAFRIFRGDQRAIGEVMIDAQLADEFACMGYAKFYGMMDTEPSFNHWFTSLSSSIEKLAAAAAPHSARLVAFQHNLIDLINLLDPEGIRFPDWQRRKLQERNPLSRGELEVLKEIANGSSYDEIAERLQISLQTADARMMRIRAKLGGKASRR